MVGAAAGAATFLLNTAATLAPHPRRLLIFMEQTWRCVNALFRMTLVYQVEFRPGGVYARVHVGSGPKADDGQHLINKGSSLCLSGSEGNGIVRF